MDVGGNFLFFIITLFWYNSSKLKIIFVEAKPILKNVWPNFNAKDSVFADLDVGFYRY